jgi:hypothetical protein
MHVQDAVLLPEHYLKKGLMLLPSDRRQAGHVGEKGVVIGCKQESSGSLQIA